jgi:uncharacterized OB-fold protein
VISPVTVAVCLSCGHAAFPARALCPRCGGREWRAERADTGVVEDVTSRARDGKASIHLAEVRTGPGPLMVVRCREGTRRGEAVALERRGAVVWAV